MGFKIILSKYFIIAGESSGDFHASHLMREMKKIDNSISFSGLGGKLMELEGLSSLSDINKMAVMGFWEVLKNLKFLKSVEKNVLKHLKKTSIDAVILIDYPGKSTQNQLDQINQSIRLQGTSVNGWILIDPFLRV